MFVKNLPVQNKKILLSLLVKLEIRNIFLRHMQCKNSLMDATDHPLMKKNYVIQYDMRVPIRNFLAESVL